MGSAKPKWLSLLEADIVSITTKAAQTIWPGPSPSDPPFFNYRLEHILQVERDAKRLIAAVGGDEDVIFASVWIHDRFQPQYMDTDHPKEAEDWARSHLASIGFPAKKVDSVCYCVANHSNPPESIPADKHEARLLWDADKLSKIGSTSIVADILASPAFSDQVTSFQEFAARSQDKVSDLIEFPELFYFDFSKKMARERLRAQKVFSEGLAEEAGVYISA